MHPALPRTSVPARHRPSPPRSSGTGCPENRLVRTAHSRRTSQSRRPLPPGCLRWFEKTNPLGGTRPPAVGWSASLPPDGVAPAVPVCANHSPPLQLLQYFLVQLTQLLPVCVAA